MSEQQENQHLVKLVSDIQQSIDQAQQKYDKAEEEIKACSNENNESYTLQLDSQTKLETCEIDLQNSKDEYQIVVKNIEQTKASYNKLEEIIKSGEVDLSNSKDSEKELNTQIQDVVNKIGKTETQISNYEQEISGCSQEFQDKQMYTNRLNTRNDELKQKIEELNKFNTQEKLAEKKQKQEEQKQILEEKEMQEEQLNNIKTRLETAVKNQSCAQVGLRELKSHHQKHIKSLDQIKKNIKEKENSLTDYKKQLAYVKSDLSIHQKRQEELIQNIQNIGKQKVEEYKNYLSATKKIEQNDRKIEQSNNELRFQRQAILDYRMKVIDIQQKISLESLNPKIQQKVVKN